MEQYTIVTVVFPAEIDLLKVQARSLEKYFDRSLLGSILIIDNSLRGLRRATVASIRSAYGDLAPLVRVVPRSKVANIPLATGWWTQQVLKLLIARHVTTERYLILDAKSHLVERLDRDFLEAPDGRATVNFYSYLDHPLKCSLINALSYFSLAFPECGRFSATVPPFTMFTSQVLKLVEFIERERGQFAKEMIDNNLTEFFLYGAWLKLNGLFEDLYYDHQKFCPIVWEQNAHRSGVGEAIASSNLSKLPFFAVHRLSFVHLDAESIELLAAFWAERGLFEFDQAKAFIRRRQSRDWVDRMKQRLAMYVARIGVKVFRRSRRTGPLPQQA